MHIYIYTDICTYVRRLCCHSLLLCLLVFVLPSCNLYKSIHLLTLKPPSTGTEPKRRPSLPVSPVVRWWQCNQLDRPALIGDKLTEEHA